MTDELIERVKQAIYSNEAGSMMLDEDAFDDLEDFDKVMYHSRAMAALSAIRPGDVLPNGLVAMPAEPTRKMKDAALDSLDTACNRMADDELGDEPGTHAKSIALDACCFAYPAMLAAAKGE